MKNSHHLRFSQHSFILWFWQVMTQAEPTALLNRPGCTPCSLVHG